VCLSARINAEGTQKYMTPILIKYILAETEVLPAIDPTSLYEFIMAGNGVFLRARRTGLEAMIPISTCEIRGLQPIEPYVRLEAGKIPLVCTQAILVEFQSDLPNESLVWVRLENKKWKLIKPSQIADENSVHPVDPFDPAGIAALVDVHSHDTMEPFFSTQDDKDETGFRIFAVFGLLGTEPCVMARVGIYGYYWRLDAGDVFVLPVSAKDITELSLKQAALLAAEMEVEDGITAGCS
jgi:PRTRC genetic system protein A